MNHTLRVRGAARLAGAALLLACSDPVEPPGGRGARPILFIGRALEGGDPAIYAVNGDGSGLRRLTSGAGEATYPAWSRDGTRFAFASGTLGDSEIWLMEPSGESPARPAGLPRCGDYYTRLTWAPAGDWIAAECGVHTFLFDVRAGTGYSLFERLGTPVRYHDWSPDGTRLAFGSTVAGDTVASTSTVGPDGNGLALLLTGAEEATWSPDGRRLAFIRWSRSSDGIHMANADGSGRHRVTTPDSVSIDEGPTWSPDGRWLAFHRYSERCEAIPSPPYERCTVHWSVHVVRADGTGLRRVTPDSLDATRPAW